MATRIDDTGDIPPDGRADSLAKADPEAGSVPGPDARSDAEVDREKWLSPAVAGIGSASLLADLGHEIPTSLLPSFLSSVLGAPASALGFIEGISDGLAGLARLAGGARADDPARRKVIAVGGYTLTALFSGGIAATTSVWQTGLLRAGAWIARGYRVPARNALLADAVPARAYGRAYGFERAMDNLGAILGPLSAAVLVATFGVRWAIAASVLPGLLAAGAILYAIRRLEPNRSAASSALGTKSATVVRRESPEGRPGNRPPEPDRPPVAVEYQLHRRTIVQRLRRLFGPRLRWLFVGVSAFEFGNCAATLLILRATELLSPELGAVGATTTALLLYTAYNATASGASILAGRYSDRQGPARAMVLGVVAFLVAYAAFGLGPKSWVLLGASFLCAGVGIGFVETGEHAAVASRVPQDLRGSGFGLLAGVQSLGNLTASSVAGLVWAEIGPAWAFGYLAVCMAVAAGVLAGLSVSDRGDSETRPART